MLHQVLKAIEVFNNAYLMANEYEYQIPIDLETF